MSKYIIIKTNSIRVTPVKEAKLDLSLNFEMKEQVNQQEPQITTNNDAKRTLEQREEDFDLYGQLIDIWAQFDQSFWNSESFFLVVQGLLFAGLFGFLSTTPPPDPAFIFPIEIVGFILSIIWLFVGSRKKEAIRIIEDEARALETLLFKDRFDSEKRVIYPMIFHANKAIFSKKKNGQFDRGMDEDVRKRIRENYFKLMFNDNPTKRKQMNQWLSTKFSSIQLITVHLTMTFVLVWFESLMLTLASIIVSYWSLTETYWFNIHAFDLVVAMLLIVALAAVIIVCYRALAWVRSQK